MKAPAQRGSLTTKRYTEKEHRKGGRPDNPKKSWNDTALGMYLVLALRASMRPLP